MKPILIQIGSIPIYSFGVMLVVAFFICCWIVNLELRRKGLDHQVKADSLVISVLLGGLVGARGYYILENFTEFLRAPFEIFSGGGLVWYGGVLGGVVALTYVVHRKKLNWLQTADVLAPALALGYGIGRIGCLLAGDGDYGKPSDLPWAMAFPDGIVPTTIPVHPTPVYEAMLMTAVFLVLWRLRKKMHPAGFLFGLYLVLASLERFSIEFLRLNPILAFHLTMAQFISIMSLSFGFILLLNCTKDPSFRQTNL